MNAKSQFCKSITHLDVAFIYYCSLNFTQTVILISQHRLFMFSYLGKFHSVWGSSPITFVLCNIQNTLRLCVCFLDTSQSINKACLWAFVPLLSSVVFQHSTADLRLLSKIPVAKRDRERDTSTKTIFKKEYSPVL